MGTTEKLARFVMETGYSDFPKEVVGVTKNHILDCLGAMLAGSREPVSQIVMRYVKNNGGVAEAGAIGGGFRTSLSNAALVNGTSGHARELEAVGKYPASDTLHVIAAALSVAERFKLSGKSVLEGVIFGEEVQGRVGLGAPAGFYRGHCGISLYGPLAVAAAVSKMIGLNIHQAQMAMGVAISESGGFHRQTGSMTHLFESGLSSRNGVEAALLAKEGMTSEPNLLEGEGGFCDLYCSKEGYDLEIMTRDLGNPFYILSPGVSVKKHGCCFFNHRSLDALFQLIEEQDLHYDEVESVQVDVDPKVPKLLRFPEPENGEQAKFSLQQSLGAALVDRKVDLPYVRPFTDAGAVDPKYREARKKVKVIVHEDWEPGWAFFHSSVIVKLKDGRSYSKGVDVLKGSPEMPLSKEELVTRYKNCAQGILASDQMQRSIDLVFNLENLENVLELMELVTFGSPR